MYRLRRLCSKDEDFQTSLEGLRLRCYNSGYDRTMVDQILRNAASLKREFNPKQHVAETVSKIRWVVQSGSMFEKEQTEFVRNINEVLKEHLVTFEIVKMTGPTIGSQLFNNFDESDALQPDCRGKCFVCKNNARGDPESVVSSVTKKKYYISPNVTCWNIRDHM